MMFDPMGIKTHLEFSGLACRSVFLMACSRVRDLVLLNSRPAVLELVDLTNADLDHDPQNCDLPIGAIEAEPIVADDDCEIDLGDPSISRPLAVPVQQPAFPVCTLNPLLTHANLCFQSLITLK